MHHRQGEQGRDYVFVRDCARANLLALPKEHTPGIFNLASGLGTSVNQVFQSLKTLTNYTLVDHHGPPKLGETRRIFLDASKAERELGWRPKVSLDEGLRRTVEYFKSAERYN